MEKDTKLQIPISKVLKKNLEKKSKSMGFSSVNELVRVLLQDFVINDSLLRFVPKEEIPMVDEETERRIGESLKDYAEGRYTTITKGNLKQWLDSL